MNSMKSQYKIVFFGTSDFAAGPVLSVLEKNFDVVSSIRQPIKFDEQTLKEFKNLNADFFVVASFGQILPNEILNIPKIASINIHPSLLPKYRGPSPIQSQILNNDTKTGVTFIKMDDEVDHGPILAQIDDEIKNDDTFESLAKRLFEKSANHLFEVLNNYAEDKLIPQNDSLATYTKLLTKTDGYIDASIINNKSSIINRMIRAYYPWPGVWTKYNLSNKEIIIKLLPNEKVQVEGKKQMSYKDFINGYSAGGKILLEKLKLLK